MGLLSINYGWFQADLDWQFIWNLWPTLLVLWGLSFLLPKGFQAVAAVLTVVGVFLFILAGTQRLNSGWQKNARGVVNQEFSAELQPESSSARLEFDSGAGEFIIAGPTAKLLSAKTSSTIGQYRLDQSGSGSETNLRLVMESGGYFRLGKNQNRAEMSLNENPVWDLALNLGAASGNFDLSGYKVRKTIIRSGASSLDLKMSDKLDISEADVETGASSVKILVPASAGVEVVADTGLASKDFQGFDRVTENLYRTPNFETAQKKIRLNIRAGASSIEIQSY